MNTTPKTMTHTPTPWNYRQSYSHGEPQELIIHSGRFNICSMQHGERYKELMDAAHIVRCVNEREELLETLRLIVLNAETALKYISHTPKDTHTLQNILHWPGMVKAHGVLARAEREEG